jgi:hypothetical protein
MANTAGSNQSPHRPRTDAESLSGLLDRENTLACVQTSSAVSDVADFHAPNFVFTP